MPPASPTVATWELALRLRERRAQLGIEVDTITEALGFTRNYWSAVENERRILAADKLVALLDLFEFDKDEHRELTELREAAKRRGWWSNYSGLFSTELQRFFGLEHGAQTIRTYESLIIPGLLQTEAYVHAMISADIAVRQVEVDQRVEVRMRRRDRLTTDEPLHLTAVISQAALVQQTGGPTVLREQLKHMASMIEKYPDTIDVRVIPFTATACGLFGASTFHLIDFESPKLPTLAWQETVTAAGIIDDPIQVRDLSLTYGEALRRTLNAQDSLRLIRRSAKELA
ncbi:MAG TPA: Scr1 family TA system antitoxin-like transcriptional regulator [Actinophytocola sp.]|jgi:transcriptional regulator with XRE-family HTH domain|uniref:Scr1 family TA system antitoxin-like transcriptional regulator n=1 Tax=Actinophytocola sp. TaxID=1872138 RepID=UPI002DFE4371|nr:Scr1 family TA system antitoxin-like transcriptional regulator [Actinophytocola sp.]